MGKKTINPWTWQDPLSFSQAIEITGSAKTLFCAGQASISSEGKPLHENDMEAQLSLSLENIEAVLRGGDYDWTNIMRLTVYTTDVDRFFEHYNLLVKKLENTRPKPIINVIGIKRLVFPELLVEIEATAMK